MREKIEFWLIRTVAGALGLLPRGVARKMAALLVWMAFPLLSRLRRVGMRNLEMALPTLTIDERTLILKGVLALGPELLGDFC